MTAELSEWRRAVLPLKPAPCGGIVVPALPVPVQRVLPPPARVGVCRWLLISRSPSESSLCSASGATALRVLLLALAVIDDLGTILVIAAFSHRDRA